MRWSWCAVLGSLGLLAARAEASSALEFPDNGVAQFSRGGAWLATASDPIAAHYNPGAIATQPTSFGIGANLVVQEICFDRRDEAGEPTGPDRAFTDLKYTETCNANAGKMNAIPNAAFVWRASERLALGIALVTPSSYGKIDWAASAPARPNPSFRGDAPAAQRYLSLGTQGTILFPTLSAGYSLTDRLHVGAGFVAGIALLELQSMSISNVTGLQTDDASLDTRSKVNAKDLFVPGFVVGGLYSASKNLDLGAWYRFMDKIRAEGDLELTAPFYVNNRPRSVCSTPNVEPTGGCAAVTEADDAARITLTIPMEARIGARWHMPFRAASGLQAERLRKDPYPTRDPLRDDLYDLELDLTWANNSAADEVQIRFDPGINVLGLPGTVPTNADRPTGWKDSFGARLGGQYALIRNLAGIRLGTWIETPAVEAEYLSVTGVPAWRGGFGGGFVLRVQAVDLEAGYQHIWNGGLDNEGKGKLKAIAGSGSDDNRSNHAVNGGSVTQHANVVSFGVVARL
jgi:long-subunit fatty acid transport protein